MHVLANVDSSRPAAVSPQQYRWTDTRQSGVERVMLDRVDGERARATSIVRYAAGACFPHHLHPGGEEILVLSGTFSEGGEHYPAGWYLRNPPGSSHQPCSREGAIIFVKLGQMRPGENRRVRIDTGDPTRWQRSGDREICPLFSDDWEQVCLHRLPPRETLRLGQAAGTELLVVSGEVVVDDRAYPRGSWIRLPAGECPAIAAGEQVAMLYLKTGRPRAAAVGA